METVEKLSKKFTLAIVWVSCIKKTGIQTDLSENIIRKSALQNSLADIKVCSVNDE